MGETNYEIVFIAVAGTLMVLLIITFIVLFLLAYQKRYFAHQNKLAALERQHQEESLKAQMEMQETTLQYVGRELHDNIGQVLSLIKLNLLTPDEQQLANSKQLLSKAIQDLRILSHELNLNWATDVAIEDFITTELQKLSQTGHYKTKYEQNGTFKLPDQADKVVFFRMVQEVLQNIIKHADASLITCSVDVLGSMTIQDNGKGFNQANLNKGLGLGSLQHRAELMELNVAIEAAEGEGTSVTFSKK